VLGPLFETVFRLELRDETFVPQVNVSVLKAELSWVTDEFIADLVFKIVVRLGFESLLVDQSAAGNLVCIWSILARCLLIGTGFSGDTKVGMILEVFSCVFAL
jgi:hypothetical protein